MDCPDAPRVPAPVSLPFIHHSSLRTHHSERAPLPSILAASFLDYVFLLLGLVMIAIPIYFTVKLLQTAITGRRPTRYFDDKKEAEEEE